MGNGGKADVSKFKKSAIRLGVVIAIYLLPADLALGKEALVGTTTANFLKLGTHAQAVGLGEAVTALADGISFAAYNPAAVQAKSLTLAATHTLLYEGVNLEDIALGIPFGERAGMFLRGSGVMFDKTERTDLNGNKIGTYSSNAFSAGLGFYAHAGSFSLGVFGKSIQQKIDSHKSSAVAADVGMRYLTPLAGLSIGVSCLNAGRPAKFIAQEDELPTSVRAGLGYDNGFWKIGADVVQYRDQAAFFAAGTELTLFGGLRFRAGYSSSSELSSPIRGGIGFRFTALDFNYAYTPGTDFGGSHRMTLTIR